MRREKSNQTMLSLLGILTSVFRFANSQNMSGKLIESVSVHEKGLCNRMIKFPPILYLRFCTCPKSFGFRLSVMSYCLMSP